MTIDHLCRIKACVNPDHLEAVTNEVNASRTAGRRRLRSDARLTWTEVKAIRASTEPYRVLSAEYGVARGTISKIRTGKHYRPELAEIDTTENGP
jgi:hypothetical protein